MYILHLALIKTAKCTAEPGEKLAPPSSAALYRIVLKSQIINLLSAYILFARMGLPTENVAGGASVNQR